MPLIIVNTVCIVLLLLFGWQLHTEPQNEAEDQTCAKEQPKTHTEISVHSAFSSHQQSRQAARGAGMEMEKLKKSTCRCSHPKKEEFTRHLVKKAAGVDFTPGPTPHSSSKAFVMCCTVYLSSIQHIERSRFQWFYQCIDMCCMFYYVVTNKKLVVSREDWTISKYLL